MAEWANANDLINNFIILDCKMAMPPSSINPRQKYAHSSIKHSYEIRRTVD